jgi:hypothetical protein
LVVARVVAGILHHSLQHLLDSIPVFGVELRWLNIEVLANVHELTPAATVVHERQSSTGAAKATSTPDTVKVGLIIRSTTRQVRDVVVDDHGDGLHVDSACEDVGGDQNLRLACAEPLEDLIACGTLESAREGGDFVAVCSHAALNLCGGVAALDEDDGGSDGHQTVKLEQCSILRLIVVTIEIHLLDTLNCELLHLECDLVGLRGEEVRKVEDLRRESGGEQDHLNRLWHLLLDALALVAHALKVEHVVGLVKGEDLDLTGVQLAALDHVVDCARCTDNDLTSDLLSFVGRVWDGLSDLESLVLQEDTEHLAVTRDLSGQLSSRRKHETLRRRVVEVNTREHVESECCSLACSGLRLTDEVLRRVLQEQREGALLDLRGLEELVDRQRAEQLGNTRED